MKRFKVIIASVAAIICASFATAQSQELVDKFNQAATLIGEKKFAEAIPLLTAVVNEGAQDESATELVMKAQKIIPQCYFQNAVANLKAQNYDEARKQADIALEKSQLYGVPNITGLSKRVLRDINNVQAGTAFNAKNYRKAIIMYGRNYKENPGDVESAMNLAMSYAEDRDIDSAMVIYKKVIVLGQDNAKYAEMAAKAKDRASTYLLLVADSSARANDVERVFVMTGEVIELQPQNPTAYMLRLQAANNAKDYDKVISVGEKAAEIQTTPEMKSSAYFLLGVAYQNKDNKAKAIELFRKVTVGKDVAAAKTQIAVLSKK